MKYVLIIVEEDGIANTLKILLKEKYFIAVETPGKAFQSIIERKPDVIIVDNSFRYISGYEVIEEILETVPDVPIIALVDSYGPVARCLMNMGVYDVIEKPFDPERLIYSIKRVLYYVGVKRTERSETVQIASDRTDAGFEDTFFQKLSELLVENFSNPDRLIYAIINLLRIQFSLAGISLFIRRMDEFIFCDAIGMDKNFLKTIKFNINSALYRCLMTEKKILQKDEMIPSDLNSEMNLLQAELILPLLNRDGLATGFFVFGKRLTGEVFTQDKIRFLGMVSNYLSIMIDDAFLLQDSVMQKEFQKIILENVPSGIIVLDSDFNIRIFNKQAESILGKKISDVIGFSIENLGVEFASKVKDIVVRNEPVKRKEFFIGTLKKWFGMSCDFIKQNNNILWTIVIFQDITPAKEMENERKRLEHHQYWQQIAKQLSHEIKNPLVAIKTFACLLPEKFSDESFRTEFYNIVNDEINKLTVLVEKIARLADNENLVLNNANCIEILQKVNKKFPSAQIIPKDRVNFSALVDAGKIQEAFEFLLDFCVQDAGENGEVKIFLANGINCHEIIIEESGNFFDLQPTEEIFQPFSNRLSALTSLNLAICSKIIEAHKGKVRFEMLPEGKKRFVLTLPAARG
ncbi:MAG: response regulator [bacterium]|nr:response regulator [bacterium]